MAEEDDPMEETGGLAQEVSGRREEVSGQGRTRGRIRTGEKAGEQNVEAGGNGQPEEMAVEKAAAEAMTETSNGGERWMRRPR